jgi:hypothetical protein
MRSPRESRPTRGSNSCRLISSRPSASTVVKTVNNMPNHPRAISCVMARPRALRSTGLKSCISTCPSPPSRRTRCCSLVPVIEALSPGGVVAPTRLNGAITVRLDSLAGAISTTPGSSPNTSPSRIKVVEDPMNRGTIAIMERERRNLSSPSTMVSNLHPLSSRAERIACTTEAGPFLRDAWYSEEFSKFLILALSKVRYSTIDHLASWNSAVPL